MASPFQVFPDPPVETLRRICLAQLLISVSALTSTVVLLSKVVPAMLGGLQ